MTDKNAIDMRPTAETKEIRSRVPQLSQNKLKTNNKYGRKQTRSLSLSASLYYRADVGTPKHRSRIIFTGCRKSESPSEAETVQDIIWDPASPPSVWNGKGGGEGIRVVEISEIVNRIAPNDERPVNKDSVLHWIGDTAISCTPEIQQPRGRRCLARRQSNNVEDLMKLAKQFDLNMTRQHKERNLERLQNSEETKCKDWHKHNKLMAISPESASTKASAGEAKGLRNEEELHALFDGPTQHLSGRLSPPSSNSSQDNRTEKTAVYGMRQATSDSKNLPEDPEVSKPGFDDDWENDNLLSDFFVLEVTQNPELLSSCTAKTTSQIGSSASKIREPTMAASSSGSSSGAGCPQSHQLTSDYTRISSKTFSNSITFRSGSPVQSGPIKQLPKTSSDSVSTYSKYQKAHAIGRKQKIVLTSVCPGLKGLASSAGVSGKDMDALWGDIDYDDMLYQACDDLERISASQDQQTDKNSTKPSNSSPNTLSIITTSSSNMSRTSRPVKSQHSTDHKQPVCVFACSHSTRGASGIHGSKQNLSESASALQVNQCPQNSRQQYNFIQLRSATGKSGDNSYHSTFKRHQSDPEALRNKVFIAAHPIVKCSAAEIERKKQEAIARRRLRLQTTQKPGAPT